MQTHNLWLKREVVPFVAQDLKDLEVRVRDERCEHIQVGDIIVFNKSLRRVVKTIRRYTSFEVMLDAENPSRIMPGWKKEEILQALNQIFSERKRRLGVMVFELEVDD